MSDHLRRNNWLLKNVSHTSTCKYVQTQMTNHANLNVQLALIWND